MSRRSRSGGLWDTPFGMELPSLVEAVQRVSVTVTAGSANASVSPSPAVDWTRTLIEIDGSASSIGPTSNYDIGVYLDVNGTQLRANRLSTGLGDMTVYADLVTYRPGVIKRIQRGTITNAAVGTNTATLSFAVVVGRTVPRFLGAQTNDDNSAVWPGRVELTNATTVTYFGAHPGATNIGSFEVVEFN